MGEMFELENIEIDISCTKEINKFCGLGERHRFPTITIGKGYCYFNKAAKPFVPAYFNWRVNDEWVVLVPCTSGMANAYKRIKNGPGLWATFPKALNMSRLMYGVHKLYKTKAGLCFKRYETVDERG